MRDLTIDEIVFLWNAMYRYDHKLHGFSFQDEGEASGEITADKVDDFKSTYGDLL